MKKYIFFILTAICLNSFSMELNLESFQDLSVKINNNNSNNIKYNSLEDFVCLLTSEESLDVNYVINFFQNLNPADYKIACQAVINFGRQDIFEKIKLLVDNMYSLENFICLLTSKEKNNSKLLFEIYRNLNNQDAQEAKDYLAQFERQDVLDLIDPKPVQNSQNYFSLRRQANVVQALARKHNFKLVGSGSNENYSVPRIDPNTDFNNLETIYNSFMQHFKNDIDQINNNYDLIEYFDAASKIKSSSYSSVQIFGYIHSKLSELNNNAKEVFEASFGYFEVYLDQIRAESLKCKNFQENSEITPSANNLQLINICDSRPQAVSRQVTPGQLIRRTTQLRDIDMQEEALAESEIKDSKREI